MNSADKKSFLRQLFELTEKYDVEFTFRRIADIEGLCVVITKYREKDLLPIQHMASVGKLDLEDFLDMFEENLLDNMVRRLEEYECKLEMEKRYV